MSQSTETYITQPAICILDPRTLLISLRRGSVTRVDRGYSRSLPPFVLLAFRLQRSPRLGRHAAIRQALRGCSHGIRERRLRGVRYDGEKHQVVVGLEAYAPDDFPSRERAKDDDEDSEGEEGKGFGAKGIDRHGFCSTEDLEFKQNPWGFVRMLFKLCSR